MGHPYVAYQTLRRILYEKINERTLELPCKKEVIDTDPLTKCREKELVAVITCCDDDDTYHPWKNNPKPPKAIWESSMKMHGKNLLEQAP